MRFADLHCHSTFYAINRMRHTPGLEDNPDVFHPWHELPSNLKNMKAGKRGNEYSQANFPRLVKGNVQLIFHSFTPIEKGFFVGSCHGDEYPFLSELIALFSGKTIAQSALALATGGLDSAALRATRLIRNRGPLRKLIQAFVLKYSASRIKHIVSDNYDYWEELLAEYNFLKSRDGVPAEVHVDLGHGIENIKGCYQIATSTQDIERFNEEQPGEMILVLTIEGAHVFSMNRKQQREPETVIFERIQQLKSWDHPILFITLAHHFDNGLCGHAHSLIDSADLVMDQSVRLFEDFERENELGIRVVRELHDLDENLNDRGGRRILLDTRHMSPRTRKSYYEEIITPYNTRHKKRSKRERKGYPMIPVVMSHAAYSGVATLDELIQNAPMEDDHWYNNPYYAWGINLCDEDIQAVHQSEGLVGIVFDQRITGKPPSQKMPPTLAKEQLFKQIFAIVDAIMLDHRLNARQKQKIWDCISLGPDYDGMIDPVSDYPTAMSFPKFAEDLREYLSRFRHTRMIDKIGVDELVEKICWRNAYDFALRHMPAAAGELTKAPANKSARATA